MSKTIFEQALKEEGVSGPLANLAWSIYGQESSGGTNTTTSNRGARGGMQILPDTFKEVADKGWNIDDPLQNARGGIRYLKNMYNRGGGDPRLGAIGYYGGPGGQDNAKAGRAVSDPKNPNAPNTFGYADQVVARMNGAPIARADQGATVTQPIVEAPKAPAHQVEIVAKPYQPMPTNQDPWAQFQAVAPQVMPLNSLAYGDVPVQSGYQPPPMQVAAVNTPIDFRRFQGWGTKV